MIKRLICKHEYSFYHRGKYMPLFAVSQWDKWCFVCKKCGKRSVLYDMYLHDLWKSICEKVDREKAMGIDNSEYDNMRFIIGHHIYMGKGAYYMKKRFKNYHQEDPCNYYR